MSLLCDILSCQRLEDLCAGFPWSGFVSCCPSGWLILWLQSDWQPGRALPASCLAWDSCITILRHGPLPSHSTQAINMMTTPPSIPPLFAPCLIPVPVPTCLRKHWTSLPSWFVSLLSVSRYINMHVGVSGFEHWCSIFTEGWSIARLSSFL